jgi:L-xylulokinase
MFADVLGLPVEVSDAEESGARGAALAAGIGLGAYRDVNDAMQRGTRAGRSHLPDATLEDLYTQRFAVYRRLVAAMGPIWDSLASTS